MDVLTAAWLGSGYQPDAPASHRDGSCARCGADAALTPTGTVVSKSFTAFDGWRDVGGRGLCPPCAWGYTAPALRQVPHQVLREPARLIALTVAQVAIRLLLGRLQEGGALVVPLRPGRKHLMPSAGWGRITVDNAELSWTDREASLLGDVLTLRRAGFGTRMVREPAPPYTVLRRRPTATWAALLDAWARLAPWRSPDNPWLNLALHVTTPLKEIP